MASLVPSEELSGQRGHSEELYVKGKRKKPPLLRTIGRAVAGIISLVALLLSLVNFYLTVYEQPILNIFAGCNWRHGQGIPGLGTDLEYFVIPVTIVNDGARTGTVLAFDLTVEKNGSSKTFPANFITSGLDDKVQQMFAPIAVAGHASASSSIMFIQLARPEPLILGDAGSFHATLKIRPTVPASYRFINSLFAGAGADLHFEPVAPVFDRRPASFDACARARPASSGTSRKVNDGTTE